MLSSVSSSPARSVFRPLLRPAVELQRWNGSLEDHLRDRLAILIAPAEVADERRAEVARVLHHQRLIQPVLPDQRQSFGFTHDVLAAHQDRDRISRDQLQRDEAERAGPPEHGQYDTQVREPPAHQLTG